MILSERIRQYRIMYLAKSLKEVQEGTVIQRKRVCLETKPELLHSRELTSFYKYHNSPEKMLKQTQELTTSFNILLFLFLAHSSAMCIR